MNQHISRNDVLSLFRNLLRQVNNNITRVSNNSLFKNYVIQEFKQNAGLKDETLRLEHYKIAKAYFTLLDSAQKQYSLWDAYDMNPKIVDSQEILKRKAAAVGLQLPKSS